MMQDLKRNWFVISKLTKEFDEGIWRSFTQAPKNLKTLHFNSLLLTKVKYIMFELKKYRGAMFNGTEDWCKIWRKTDLRFLKTFVYRLKNSDFILESKTAELNWKQNLLNYFEIARIFPILTSRNSLLNTFLIVNITPICKR